MAVHLATQSETTFSTAAYIWFSLHHSTEVCRWRHAGVGNIARAEAALFALMFGKNLAEPASPFEQDTKKAPASSSSRSRHASSSYDKDGGIVHLGRKCLWLRAKESSVSAYP